MINAMITQTRKAWRRKQIRLSWILKKTASCGGITILLLLQLCRHVPAATGFATSVHFSNFLTCGIRQQRPFLVAPVLETTGRTPSREIGRKTPLEIISSPLQIELTNTTDLEMASMSALGLAFSIGIIYSLASSNPSEGNFQLEGRALETVYANVIDAALPRDATDVLTVVLGEAIGGFIGAASTTIVTSLLRLKMEVNQKAMLVEAVADGDYFLARAAVLPLLSALGVPDVIASIASVLLATIPYELVKLGPKRRKMMQAADDLIMERMLVEQKRKKRGSWGIPITETPSAQQSVRSVESKERLLDIPDVFADIIKWLEYDILKTDYGGTFMDANGMTMTGVEGAIFGFLAGLSSQLYLDTVRTYTDYGPIEKREEARTRTLSGWASLYSTTCFSTAALFGVYESCKKPISTYVAGVLSGGVDGCLGSSNVKTCMTAFIKNNPPEATLGAQVRSLVTLLVSLSDRISVDDSFDAEQYIRAAIVQLYSLFH